MTARTRRLPLLALALLAGGEMLAQAYWQQRVDHAIDVRLDDTAHTLHGHAAFTYHNHAPVTLDTIWVHLWANAYRDRTSALCRQLTDNGDLDLYFARPEERGHTDSLDFHTMETVAPGEQRRRGHAWGPHPVHADIAWIKLDKPLRPGETITIATPFRVKVPDGKFSRLGHTGQAYAITQWYPKPAVYDKDGWHFMPYLSNGEFYNEFGEYDVSITLPANYVVGATGLLQNESERAWMDSLAALPLPASTSNAFPPSATGMKTLRFVQDRVHDFAWFADKRFIVRKGELKLRSIFNTVTTWALFTPANAAAWDRVAIDAINESVRLYSEWAGEYRYEACTAVDGTISAGGGMEYPMITVIGNMGSDLALDQVIAHEVGHNWFQGMLASNERDHPWLDEGLNSFHELRYMRERYPGASMVTGVPGLRNMLAHVADPHHFQYEAMYRMNARRNLDQALNGRSEAFTQMNYGAMVYGKSALVLDQLHAMVGSQRMDRAMRAYFEEWQYRHPGPDDFRRVMERELAMDLGWLFDELVATDHKVDVRAVKLRGDRLTYRSTAMDGAHFPISAWKDSAALGTTWVRTDNGRGTVALPWPDADRVRIDAEGRTLDIDRRNNAVRGHGLFRRWAKPQAKFLFGVERDDRRSVYWTPIAAWNGHDGLQLGLGLTNTTFPSQRTEWVVAPLYALGSERLGGAARIEHHFDRLRGGPFRNIHLGLNARSASTFHDHHANAWYGKVSPSIDFDLRRPLAKPWQHRFGLRAVHLVQQAVADPPEGPSTRHSAERTYGELHYTAADRRKLHPSFIRPVVTIGEEFVRGALEVEQGLTFNKRNDQLRLRGFFGTFFHKDNDQLTNGMHAWGLSWGPEDMLFDHAYFERGATDRLPGRQFNKQQGAFKTPFVQGGSDSWIVAINAELDLPIPLPIALFGSMGRVPITTITPAGRTTGAANYFEAGIGVIAMRDVLEIWFPLLVSERIADEEKFLGRDMGDRIRFIFALEKLDPTRVIRKIKP
ncbi:MAG: M1 family metallopeptidase [Flavobacteriales bacterium]|nr:M1 family metallopeptidase [Flavobacteriales bacterium]